MHERGVIYNRERKKQIIDFRGMRYGSITPTDVDGFLDFGNKLFVYFEIKHDDAPLPYGQRLALERICISHYNSGIPCYIIVARHMVHDCSRDIHAGETIVSEVYIPDASQEICKHPKDGRWVPPRHENITLSDAVYELRRRHNIVPKDPGF